MTLLDLNSNLIHQHERIRKYQNPSLGNEHEWDEGRRLFMNLLPKKKVTVIIPKIMSWRAGSCQDLLNQMRIQLLFGQKNQI
jgi:hypothetical protein